MNLFKCAATIITFLSTPVNGISQPPLLPTPWTMIAKNSKIPLAEYPRPQLKRNLWMCLNGNWDYMGGVNVPDALHPSEPATFEGIKETILVPYCPESFLWGIQRKQEINLWYRKKFEIPPAWKGRNILLHFGAVDHDATIFVNGKKVGNHAGGYDSFSFDVTSFVIKGVNSIIVAAHDKNDGKAPSGKNGPRGDYTFSSGIWQTVWLEPVNEHHISSIRLLPDVDNSRLRFLVNSVGSYKISIAVIDENKQIVLIKSNTNTNSSLDIKSPKLWSPDSPFLYYLRITLYQADGSIADTVESYFGMRSIKLGNINGAVRPLLNGKFLMQLGLLDQGYWPDGILTAPTEDALKFDMEYTKKAGYNLIRKHMKTEPQRFYYWADKLGLLVWQDMPAIWYQDIDTVSTRAMFRNELVKIIDDHYNSPSIITWVPFNENWGAFDVKEITDWVKRYDSSRLVNGNSGFNNNPTYQTAYGDPGNGDFADTHIYIGPNGASVPDKNRAASLGEFGGVGLFVRGHMWPVENNAYAYEPTSAALTDRYVLLMDQVAQLMKYKGLSVAIYTQTTDVEHEVNGVLTYDRRVEKMQLKRIKAINEWVIKESEKK